YICTLEHRTMEVYSKISVNSSEGKGMFAILIDPDKIHHNSFRTVAHKAAEADVDFLFIGGSLLSADIMEECLYEVRCETDIPLVIFPGSVFQINKAADAILLLSLISGRNPEMLIGNHVVAAPYLKASQLEIIPTGYMLIESGVSTTALYMSCTFPIPHSKDEIAVNTAMAGEMLGLKLIYLDAGSGATSPVSASMITKVKQAIGIPLIVGGGIDTPEKARRAREAGANLVVVGNAIEKDSRLIHEIAYAIHEI
nr:geranylgeranylglyceryl/heptaprenylglyceryl phosphate synthase [Bacteroidales bacterium]